MKKTLILFVTLFVFCSLIRNTNHIQILSENNETLSLIFAGDIMGHSPQFQAAFNQNDKVYNYDICFKNVKSYIESADLAIANLEVPLAGEPYSGYPNFSSPDALLEGLKYAGYDIILIANNHVVDRGKKGLERTIEVINSQKLKYAGSYLNKVQRDSIYPLIIEQKGIKIALLNCTFGTNGIAVTSPNIVNLIDTVQIKKDILKAESLNADLIVMTIHWGIEYVTRANEMQRKLALFFAKNGVNLVIGGHPHVVQDAEIFLNPDSTKVPIFYSLGNSISNQRKPNTDGGIMVKIEIGINSKQILKSSYLPVYVHKGILNGVYQYHLIPTIDFINNPSNFQINKTDSAALMFFDKATRNRLSNNEIFN